VTTATFPESGLSIVVAPDSGSARFGLAGGGPACGRRPRHLFNQQLDL
jgi:hypothetical protein